MRLRTTHELTTVDDVVARFGPRGFMTEHRLRDGDVVQFAQEQVIGLELPEKVPAGVRERFDGLRNLHIYGVFRREFFAIVETEASLLFEHALGVRFIEWHSGQIPMIHPKTGPAKVVELSDLAPFADRYRGGWRLAGDPRFNGSLASLIRWAHDHGLFAAWLAPFWRRVRQSIVIAELMKGSGARRMPDEWEAWNRAAQDEWVDSILREIWEGEQLTNERELRNLLVHRTSSLVVTPVHSARAIQHLCALISSLWSDDQRQPAEAGDGR